MSWDEPPCPDCSKPLEWVRREGDSYFFCPRDCGSQEPPGLAQCPFCEQEMKYKDGENDQWKGVRIWWCDTCRTPKKGKKTNVPDSGTPLGDRPVPPNSMFKVRKDSSD